MARSTPDGTELPVGAPSSASGPRLAAAAGSGVSRPRQRADREDLLGGADRPVHVPHLTAANQWAIQVGMAARLELHQEGYLGLRGMKPPAPYVHSGALL